jgi:hypothetical protein
MSELVVRISADIKQLEKGYEQAAKETEALQGRLSQIAKVSAVAFAALTGSIGLAVAAYREQEIQENKIKALIESTGGAAGVTAEEIGKMAEALQSVTTFGDEVIMEGQAILLTFDKIGKDIFPQVTETALNMSTVLGTDVAGAARQLGKALNDPTEGLSALSRVGVQFNEEQKKQIETLQKSGDILSAQNIILAELEKRFGGTARAAADGTGAFIQLKNTFGDLLEEIGKNFVPVLVSAAKALKGLIEFLKDNKALVTFASLTLGIGAALTGLIATVATVGIAFLKYKALITALTLAGNTTIVNILTMGGAFAKIPALIGGIVTSFGALSIAIKVLVGATGIGLILVALSTLLFSWESTWKGIKDITFAAIDGIKGILGGLADILVGVFTFDGDKVAKGWEAVKTASVNAANQTIDAVKGVVAGRKDELEITPEAGESGTEKVKDAESKKTAIVDDETKKRIQIARDERAILKAEADEVSAEEIDFLKRRQELKAEGLEASKITNEEEKALAIENIRLKNEALLQEEEAYQIARAELLTQVREQDAVLQEELRALSVEERAALDEEDLQALRDKVQTENDIEDQAAKEKVEKGIAARNKFLQDQQKFGVAYAKINSFIQSEEVQGAANAANQLVALTQSKNNTMKSIGKAAALAQNVISTAQGATSAYASLAPIPFVGPALGIAAAGALIAFGAERASNILAANQGGIVTGGVPGIDSVPALLTPGELVVPEKNFDQVVGAVRGEGQSGSSLDTAILQEISGKLDNVGGQTIINGDVLSDEVFIDRLVEKINDAVSFRNLRLNTGV